MISFTIALLALLAGYLLYSKFIERIFGPDDRPTPAVAHSDGVDFVTLPSWKVFMIQFLNIAGTGPIFGAIMGAWYGPVAYLWIIFGCIFAGAVHDYLSGMLSVRHNGANLPFLVGRYLGGKARAVMLVFSVFLLMMVGVVFVYSPALLLKDFAGSTTLWVIVIFAYYILATMLPIDKIIGKFYPIFAFALLFMAVALMVCLFVKMPELPELWSNLDDCNRNTNTAWLGTTGYMANVGTISALVGKGDAVFSDALNHASIIDGCRLSRADVFVYRHGDMDDLVRQLDAAGPRRRKLVVSDAVFSMDGDLLDLPAFLEVCRRAGAVSMIDEAHATGVLGATGRGLTEHFGCKPDIILGTLSKALGSEGGFVCASRTACDYLRNKSRSFIFSTAPGPGAMAAADTALSVLEAEPGRASALRAKAARFAAALNEAGVACATQSAIVPIPVGDERTACAVSAALEREGVLIPAIRYPTVARGAARLRAAVDIGKSDADLRRAAALLSAALRMPS